MANRHKGSAHPKQTAGKSGAQSEAYEGGGSKVAAAAKKTSDGFKKGGKVPGKKAKGKFAKGGSVFSSAKIKENTSAA